MLLFVAFNGTAQDGNYISKKKNAPKIVVMGGGGSHDFQKYFGIADGKILSKKGKNTVNYTEDNTELGKLIGDTDVLMLTNNQPLDANVKSAIFQKVNSGNLNLLIYHPSTWYNWKDWPEYNQQLVGGGSRSGEEYPTVWIVKHPKAKIVGNTLGHDERAHGHEAYKTILRNSLEWVD